MRVTLAQLEAFVWVARLGKVRDTALQLNISQPTVSLRLRDLETALGAVARDVPHAIVTKSEDGVSVLKDGQRHDAPAWPVDDVLDLTGAGDLFAAGYLFGIARGGDIRKAARLGAFAAAQVIGQFGARPQASLAQLAEAEGLLPL